MWNQNTSKVVALAIVVVTALGAAVLGCSTTRNQQVGTAKQESPDSLEFSAGIPEPSKEAPPKLMVFGGKKHDVYLGCLSCAAEDPESVFNEFGSYGSQYSPYSLWNAQTPYGTVSSPMSPRNSRATNPPIIKDQNGTFHGYLTVNEQMPQAFRSDTVRTLLKRLQSK